MMTFEVVFISLAFWQYGRMHEKQDAFSIYQQKLAVKSVLYNHQQTYSDWDIVQVEGVFDYENEKLLQNRHYKSYGGYRIITPLILPDGSRLLVDRGWIPKDYDKAPPKELEDKKGQVSFTGVVRYVPKKQAWLKGPLYGITKKVIKRVDTAVFPSVAEYKGLLIQATSSGNQNIRSFIEKPHTGAKHSEYMLTWLALAFILPSLYGALLLQRYRQNK
jgi:surfeit locus 1 family protein